ncbi:MAG: tetratricopeptide repeat protein, partial [Candidatus Accumulibacter sp.]|nr:tetratricopeptide repeat protein [Accumulibacter sp.]
MSLLMEAIRKAEEARRQGGGEGGRTATASRAEQPPMPSIGVQALDSPVDPLPDLSPRLDAIDAGLAVPAPFPTEDLAQEAYSAHMVFAATQTSEARGLLWLIAGAGLLAIVGVGGYYGWQLRAIQPPLSAAPVAAPAAMAASPASTPAAHPAPAPSAPQVEEESDIARPAPEATPPLPPTVKPIAASAAAPPPPERPPASTAPADAAPRREAVAQTPRLTRAPAPPDLSLERAYEALRTGRDDDARRAYEQALRADGKSTDALLGLATLAARQGQADEAHGYYLRALETDPSDATARAGALATGIATGSQADAGDAENLLEQALARQPDAPPLLFALGNLYARQQRWNEAQQAYFLAYAGEPGDPDIIFNLAVSLDHLRQERLAAQYYRLALDAGA